MRLVAGPGRFEVGTARKRGSLMPEELEQFAENWPDATRLERAFLLAPTVEIAKALIVGERVPLDRLDGEWVARFGLKRVTPDDRADLDDFNAVPHRPLTGCTPA